MEDERVRLSEQLVQSLRNLHEAHLLRAEALLQKHVVHDRVSVIRVLNLKVSLKNILVKSRPE